MKVITLTALVSAVALAGCVDSSSDSFIPKAPITDEIANSQLHITKIENSPVEAFDSSVKFDASSNTIKLYAQANEPASVVEIYTLDSLSGLPLGWIDLNNETHQANLSFLAFADSGERFSLACSGYCLD